MISDLFDLIVVLILVAFTIRGYWNGFIYEIAGIIALLSAFTIANTTHPLVSPYMSFVTNETLRTCATYIILFLVTMFIISFIARFLRDKIHHTFVRWVDTLAGGFFGLAKGIFICAIILLVIQSLFGQAQFIRNSRTIPYLSTLTGHIRAWMPDDLSARLRIPSAKKE